MKKRMMVSAGVAALVAGAGFGAMAVAGGDNEREAARVVTAEPSKNLRAGPSRRAGGSEIQTFYLQNEVVPPEGLGEMRGLKCPRDEGNAIGGGARTDVGIVTSYLSQLSPSTGETAKRVYYVGVDDNAGAPGAGAILEVHCAEKITVKK